MSSYSTTVAGSVTFNPYLPLPGRVLEVLGSYGPAGTAIETCNRDLARAASCSAGAIPATLRTLEADGYIERVTSPRGSLIVVTDRSGMADRSVAALESDQRILDRPIAPESANPNETPDRPTTRTDERSVMPDPPHTPLYGISTIAQQQQQQAGGREPLWNALKAAGAADRVAAEILAKQPDLTVAAFEQLRQDGRQRGNRQSPDSIGLVLWCLQHNEPLHTPKEPRHEPRSTARRRPAPDHTERSAPQPAPSLTPEQARALPRRDTSRLQALLEQRARQGGPGGGAG